jgi:hypothetical protein
MTGAPATLTTGLPTPGLAGCTGVRSPGQLHFNPGIPKGATLEEGLAKLRKVHSGEPFEASGKQRRASSSTHPGLAVGYITLDVVNRCFAGFPSTANYFKAGGTGVASNANAIVGDFILLDNLNGQGEAEPAVHIRASSAFKRGEPPPYRDPDYTFYGRFTFPNATDARQPLGNSYGSRYFVAFPDDPTVAPETDLLVWRDIKCRADYSTSPVAANKEPYWVKWITTPTIESFDENSLFEPVEYNFNLATQRVPVGRAGGIGTAGTAGWQRVNLNHTVASVGPPGGRVYFGELAQGWITTVWRANVAGSPVSAAFRSFQLSTVCK